MPTFTYSEDPAPHIIIDNFLNPRMAKQILQEWIDLEPFYEPAKIIGDENATMDDCEECNRIRNYNRNSIRDNDVCYLDQVYNDRLKSITLTEIQRVLFTDNYMRDSIKSYGGMFNIFDHLTNSQSIASRYGKCDFYGWHTDTIPHKWAERVMTVVYYLNEEPPRFEGGELLMAGKTINTHKIIEPKHNRAVIFPSQTLHAVNNVSIKDDNDFSGGRFSLNYWLGFAGGFNFR